MRLARNTIAILALASFTFAFAGETRMRAKHHEAAASEAKTMAESKEMKDCEQCSRCVMGTKKMGLPKVRETGPDDAFPVSLLYIP